MEDFWKYCILGASFWVAVDYTTAFNPDFQAWVSHMPLIWVFYLGSPLLFAYLIYQKKWDDRKLLLPLILVLFIVEILFSFNVLLFTFPIMLVMVPIAIGIYGFITYVPRWIVDKTLKKHSVFTVIMFAVWAIVAILSFTTRLKD